MTVRTAAVFFATVAALRGADFLAGADAMPLGAVFFVAAGAVAFGVVAATTRPTKSRWLARICPAKS